MNWEVKDIGLTAYSEALKIQEDAHRLVLNEGKPQLILCEHNHVYTFGKRTNTNNLLANKTLLTQIGAEVFQTERGGDITYHGPGQLVGYPILNLRKLELGVKKYVCALELAIINMLAELGIDAFQIDGLTGIWTGKENEIKRKIGAIGIRIKQGVSMHGFALNVNTDLSYFNHIVPCGISDKQVTSISEELGESNMTDVKNRFVAHFENEINKALALQTT